MAIEKIGFIAPRESVAQKCIEINGLQLRHLALILAVLGVGAACNKNEAEDVYKMIPKAQEEISVELIDKMACGDGFCDAENGEKALCQWNDDVSPEWRQQLVIEQACALYNGDLGDKGCPKDCNTLFDSTKAIFCGDEECNGNENRDNCSDCK